MLLEVATRVGGLFIASLGVVVYLYGVGASATTPHLVGCVTFATGLLIYAGWLFGDQSDGIEGRRDA